MAAGQDQIVAESMINQSWREESPGSIGHGDG